MTRFKFRRLFAVVLALSMLLGSVALPTAAFYDNRAVETVDAAAVYATDADGGGTLELDYVGIADVYEIEEAIIALAGSTISLAGRGDARFSADGDPRPGGAAAFQQYPACATVGQFAGGSWIRYEDIDLSDGLGSFRIRYLGGGSGSFDVRIGDPGNRLEGAAAIDATTLVGSVSRGAGGGLPW
ncbi:MAG: hypothetical protein FWB75_06040, partial [Oscillospiraceae bacterium]|nr:hypothetical protein [Oscillospiraceae bacterium]